MGDAPTAVAPDPSAPSLSEWHTIRPWTPHLTLSVREITSVSTTFILSSTLDARHIPDDGTEPELVHDAPNDSSNDTIIDSRGIIADAMSHGLSVDVNGSNWQRVILRMNDQADEAIIVIYGLHPGRQYDIDLALVSGGTMRKQVTTEEAENTAVDNERSDERYVLTESETQSTSIHTGNDFSQGVPSTSTSRTPTPEDRLRTLSHQLNALHTEQATLQAALKSSRRDANKTTTSLRGEIDVLKRALEKAGIAEGKARQRVRALEDAVRRANEGREQIEQLALADEQELPRLTEKQSETEKVLMKVKNEADEIRAEREKREEEEKKRKESVKGEHATLTQRLERLTVKKERLENSVIPDLEAQLAEMQREIEVAERSCFQNGDGWDSLCGDPSRTETQRRRQSHPGTIGRPLAQRTCQAPISPPQFSRHQPRSQSAYRMNSEHSASALSHSLGLPHPPGHSHSSCSPTSHPGPSGFTQSATPALSQSTNTILSQSTSSSLSRSTSSVGSSTLSSKALPFEPTRNLRVSLSSPSSSGAFCPSGLVSMGSQGALPSPSVTFASTGSGFPLSGTYQSAQITSQVSHQSHDTDVCGGQVMLGKSSVSRESGEDPWGASSN